LQLALFISVCVAFVPALMLASFSQTAWLVIACVLGVIYFPFMTVLVRKLIPSAVPVNAPAPEPSSEQTKSTPVSLENAKFCPTCGSVLGADGSCPNCA
jgi:Na+/melibiose symporter-like transporter